MKPTHLIFLILLTVSCLRPLHAQEMLGTTLGNYSGVNGIQLNPASMLSSKSYLDINLIGADVFFDNNYLYLDKKQYRFTKFFLSSFEVPEGDGETTTVSGLKLVQDIGKSNKNAYQQFRVNGPGAMLVVGKHAFGLTTGVRSVISMKNLPYDLANFAYFGLTYTPQQDINFQHDRSARGAAMTWAEIGLTYATDLYKRNFSRISAGISVRRLFGYAGFYAKINDADYLVPNDTTLVINNLNVEMAYSLPMDYNVNEYWNESFFKGGGFGFDLGVTYTRYSRIQSNGYFNHLCAQSYEDYIYRLGIALIDIGAIRFKEHAQTMAIENRGSTWMNVNQVRFTSISQFADTLSWKFYGDNTSAYTGDKFYLWLPAALSIQFDYHYYRNWYVNGSLIYGISMAPGALTRPAQISVTPRYETNWFEANLPLSLYDWSLPRIGLSLRFYYLTVGTEKLGQFFNFRNFSGMDFYFSIHYFFEKGKCRKQKQDGCMNAERRYVSGN